MSGPTRTRVAIAGASGFVGRALVRALAPSQDIIALSRGEKSSDGDGVDWRACDLFNLREAERGLAGADVAVYLVHSMMPSARLTQGRFEDLDLICADNFARAAATAGVRHIVYLGGLLPASRADHLSRHLESRFEVERTLAARGVPLTTLRAGLVIGAGGSSFDMMARLVGRLPFMLGPRWTRSRTQPIALDDVVALLAYAIAHPEIAGRAYDVGGPDVVSYAEMLRLTGEALGKRTRVVTLPIETVKLSLLWVSVITGAPQELVRPLVESLRHDMVAGDGLVLQERAGITPRTLRESLAQALHADRAQAKGRQRERADAAPRPKPDARRPPRALDRACSVQRLEVPVGRDAAWAAEEYVRWLPRYFRPFLRVEVDADRTCRFYLWPLATPLLVLSFAHDRSASDRQLFFVTGGLLSRASPGARPRLELRAALGGAFIIAAVLDFVPRLPWLVYKHTQALVHLHVMRAFARHLRRQMASGADDRMATSRRSHARSRRCPPTPRASSRGPGSPA